MRYNLAYANSSYEESIRRSRVEAQRVEHELHKAELERQAERNRQAELERQGRKFMSCSDCQELGQQVSWLLIGYTRVNNQSETRSVS